MAGKDRTGSPVRQKELRFWLEKRIAEGEILPGERINEQDLCTRFGVSRTPVREALLQLASIGLVEFRPRQGAVVAQMTVRQIAAMWEVLANLEGLCAALSARRMTPDDVNELSRIHGAAKTSVQNNDAISYAEANKAFHEALYAGCRNDYLANHVRSIRSRLNAYRRYPFQKAGEIERSFAGHQCVLKAIASGNDEEADVAMRAHVSGAMSFLDVIAEMPEITIKEPKDSQEPSERGKRPVLSDHPKAGKANRAHSKTRAGALSRGRS